MPIARSKVTSQGQISVPQEVRKKLGIVPGSVLEWDEENGKVTVRRAGTFSTADIHRTLFPEGAPPTRTLDELEEGIRRHVGERYARR